MPPPRMTLEEKRLAREMHFGRAMPPSHVAAALGRSLSAVVRLLAQRRQPEPVGRPPKLSCAQKDKLEQTLVDLVDKAQGMYEVTASMVKRKARVKASVRLVSNVLHSRGIFFRKLREKPILKPEHVSAQCGSLRRDGVRDFTSLGDLPG